MQTADISLVARLDRIVQLACEPLPYLQLRTLVESVNRDHGIPFPLFAEWGPIGVGGGVALFEVEDGGAERRRLKGASLESFEQQFHDFFLRFYCVHWRAP